MDISFKNEKIFEEFVLVFLLGLYQSYDEKALDSQRLYQWFLNGKTSSTLQKLKIDESTKNLFELFEENMRFEGVTDKHIADFSNDMIKMKNELIERLRVIDKSIQTKNPQWLKIKNNSQ